MKNLVPGLVFSSLLALLLTGSLIPARIEVKAPDSHDEVEIAAASKIEPAMSLTSGVRGLTNDDMGKVDPSPTSMENRVQVCEGRKHEQATAGKRYPRGLDMKSKGLKAGGRDKGREEADRLVLGVVRVVTISSVHNQS